MSGTQAGWTSLAKRLAEVTSLWTSQPRSPAGPSTPHSVVTRYSCAMGTTEVVWRLHDALGQRARTKVRRGVDVFAGTAGSLCGTRTTEDRVALTFDDGPHPRWTPELLDLLAERSCVVTFFLLLDHVRKRPDLVARMVADGHEVALHGVDHTRLTTLGPREVRRRTLAARLELERIAGKPVRLFRPPYGAQRFSTYLAVRSAGLDVVVWGPVARDWEEGTEEEVVARALDGLVPGSVLLMHDGLALQPGEVFPSFDRTRVVVLLLDALDARGTAAGSLAQLRGVGHDRRTVWLRP